MVEVLWENTRCALREHGFAITVRRAWCPAKREMIEILLSCTQTASLYTVANHAKAS
jgi:hypothetical protein